MISPLEIQLEFEPEKSWNGRYQFLQWIFTIFWYEIDANNSTWFHHWKSNQNPTLKRVEMTVVGLRMRIWHIYISGIHIVIIYLVNSSFFKSHKIWCYIKCFAYYDKSNSFIIPFFCGCTDSSATTAVHVYNSQLLHSKPKLWLLIAQPFLNIPIWNLHTLCIFGRRTQF
jgi:hypothetical protein